MEYCSEKHARELLERYFAGDSSLDDELALHRYFADTEEVPADLRYAATIFSVWKRRRSETTDVEIRLPKRNHLHRKLFYSLSGVAAAAAIALAVVFTLPSAPKTVYCYLNGQPIEDMDIARVQAQTALALLDGTMSKTDRSLASLNEVGRAAEKIDKAIEIVKIKK